MTRKEKALTASNIRYLLVIRGLDSEQRSVRGIGISWHLDATKANIFAMTRNLLKLGC